MPIAPAVLTHPCLSALCTADACLGALCAADAHLGASVRRGCLLLRSHIANCAGCADSPPPRCLVHCRYLLLRSHIADCASCADSPLLGCLCALRMPAQVPLCTADACYRSPTLPIVPAVLTCPQLGCPCALQVPAWVPLCTTDAILLRSHMPSLTGCADSPPMCAPLCVTVTMLVAVPQSHCLLAVVICPPHWLPQLPMLHVVPTRYAISPAWASEHDVVDLPEGKFLLCRTPDIWVPRLTHRVVPS